MNENNNEITTAVEGSINYCPSNPILFYLLSFHIHPLHINKK